MKTYFYKFISSFFTKFPIVRQLDGKQCGIACLSMICKYHGQDYSLYFLEKLCPPSREGVSLLGLKSLCDTLHLSSAAGKLTIEQLNKATLPAVLHWNQNHFVVLYKIEGDKYYIADPACGRRRLSLEDFSKQWLTPSERRIDERIEKGIALFMEPEKEFGAVQDDVKGSNRIFKPIIDEIIHHKSDMTKILSCLLIAAGLQLLFPFLTQLVVDRGIKESDIGFIWLLLIGEFMIVLGGMISSFVQGRFLLKLSTELNIGFISKFFSKLLSLPMAFFDTKLFGDLLQRLSDHTRIQTFITQQFLNMLFFTATILIMSGVLWHYNVYVFEMFLGGSTIYILWITLFLKPRRESDYELFHCMADCQGKTVQFLSSVQEIKLQNCEKIRTEEWKRAENKLFSAKLKKLQQEQIEKAGSMIINETKNILITFLTAQAVIVGDLSLGEMLAIQYIVGQLNEPINQLVYFVFSLQETKMSIERVNEINAREDEDTPRRNKILTEEFEKGIVLDNVEYKYDPNATNLTLKKISAVIPKGKITAIVGTSGSGKTTVLKMILGYYSPTSGSIRIGNIPIEDINLKQWRKQCGTVMQEGFIFSESIKGNIVMDDEDVDYDKLENAAKTANIYDYIMSLPLKFNTKIGKDGKGLSHGQKQRILLARAVYKNPSVIILDEATNSLDAKNEREIVDNLNRFYKGKTVLIVAHRLSTVKNADQILVLDHGEIVEQGHHEELVRLKGAYYDLIRNQLELDD